MPLWSDIWRVGVVDAPIEAIIAKGGVGKFSVHWLEEMPPLSFLADPFGLWQNGLLYVFVEAYDYASRKGRIDLVVLDKTFKPVQPRRTVLSEPWHLSYPFVFEWEGTFYMLPEAFRSGQVSLYRAVSFPDKWEKVEAFQFPENAIDASPLFWQNQWWMFYTPVGAKMEKQSVLQIASAPHLYGPWKTISHEPVRRNITSSRPGGTPFFTKEGGLVLPTQNCQKTYGGGITPLHIIDLSSVFFSARSGVSLSLPHSSGLYRDGMHTLSAVGDVTLVDVKKIQFSPQSLGLDIKRKIKRFSPF
ncbi:glucosamine inositolphosphorylceramide transferase family protein [Entomobacter blattae]|uniref:Glucosamine inositolphosphorylceramide transferase 1 N-terminal domain-containing protein n=1 Tax=Entomobacter blattae TaxID=2762277 RepID=A0A7H1NPA7_9PROT|nr:hypothetical protein [Entomobacter blattae]QNT77617.1 hypothetical protein JGUZn3_03660 [Entomobacter blattae]